jgi:hypothetical protein
MGYDTNDVRFVIDGGFELILGVYTITNYKISEGQEDPKNKFYLGKEFIMNKEGVLRFIVDRDGTPEVANWFNGIIPPSNNTFNHKADKLNFAFIGTLVLKIKSTIFDVGEETYTFLDVALAQGHTFASNNWWFGGTYCQNIQSNQVSYTGTNSKNEQISFDFLRGGNEVFEVQVMPCISINTANWMSKLEHSLNLNQVIMPGSHDAGMSELHHCTSPADLVGLCSQTQGLSIGNQLLAGSRYFDVRVDLDHQELVTYHRSISIGCNGQSFKDVLDQACDFLVANPTEIAIFKISHIRSDSKETKSKINDLVSTYINYLYKNNNSSVNLAYIKLDEVRGKLLLVFDYDEYCNTSEGKFRYIDVNPDNKAKINCNITVYDKYADKSDYEKMKKDQLEKWKDYAGLGNTYLFLLSWTLTAGVADDINPSNYIFNMAANANSHLSNVLYEKMIKEKSSRPNIVYIDFLNEYLAKIIIQYNFIN